MKKAKEKKPKKEKKKKELLPVEEKKPPSAKKKKANTAVSPLIIIDENVTPRKRTATPEEIAARRFLKIQKDIAEIKINNEQTREDFKHYADVGHRVFQALNERVEGFEDSMFHIMHNIKKNQFLYAHYPDEWVKNYHDIKKGIKDENDFMDGNKS